MLQSIGFSFDDTRPFCGWCPPCHITYKVLSLPTLTLFRDGEPVRSFVGARSKARLLSELDSALYR